MQDSKATKTQQESNQRDLPYAASNSSLWPCPNGCQNWVRSTDLHKPISNHHPNCEHYNSSLIDVWRVAPLGEKGGCICATEEEAREMAGNDDGLEITKQQMHRECFEQLGEFVGF